MSTLVRGPDGKIKLYCKGADTVIMARLSENQPFTEQTNIHLEDYATEGLRTLCIAMREVSEQEYRSGPRSTTRQLLRFRTEARLSIRRPK